MTIPTQASTHVSTPWEGDSIPLPVPSESASDGPASEDDTWVPETGSMGHLVLLGMSRLPEHPVRSESPLRSGMATSDSENAVIPWGRLAQGTARVVAVDAATSGSETIAPGGSQKVTPGREDIVDAPSAGDGRLPEIAKEVVATFQRGGHSQAVSSTTKAEREEVLRLPVRVLERKGSGRLALRLESRELGPIRVDLQTNQGRIEIEFHTPRAYTAELLGAHLGDLLEGMRARSLDVGQTIVQFSSAGQEEGGRDDSLPGGPFREHGDPTTHEDPSQADPQRHGRQIRGAVVEIDVPIPLRDVPQVSLQRVTGGGALDLLV